MKFTNSSLVTVLVLALGAGSACTKQEEATDVGASTGGTTGSSGGKTGSSGGSTGSSGGSTGSSGGSTGSSGGSTGSSGGSTGSSGGSTGSSGGSTGSSGGSTGSSGGSTGSSGGSSGDTSSPAETGGEGPGPGGKMVLTVDFDPATSMPPTRLCFKKEASNSGGNHSPEMHWTTPPAGTMSLVLMMEDLSNTTPHRIVCNMKPTEKGLPADIKTMVPENAIAGTGHGKPMDVWYGPGADAPAHKYEFTIFAMATPMLEKVCGPGKEKALAARDYLKMSKGNKAIVLDSDSKILWGDKTGSCK